MPHRRAHGISEAAGRRRACCLGPPHAEAGTHVDSRSRRYGDDGQRDGGGSFGRLVFFGATGDLAYKKIFPALQALARRGRLDCPGGRRRQIGVDAAIS